MELREISDHFTAPDAAVAECSGVRLSQIAPCAWSRVLRGSR